MDNQEMPENIKLDLDNVAPEPEMEAQTQEEPQHTAVEVQAMEQGWNPEGTKSAEEYLRATPLYEEIRSRGKEIKDLKSTVAELTNLVREQSEATKQQQAQGYASQAQYLEQQYVDAVELGDVDQSRELRDEIQALTQAQQALEQPATQEAAPEIPVAYQDFIERHSGWALGQDEESLRMQAVGSGLRSLYEYQGKTPEQVVDLLETNMREQFPDKFKDPDKAPQVATPTPRASGNNLNKKKMGYNDLNEHQRRAYNFIKNNPPPGGEPLSLDEYVNSLKGNNLL